MKKIYYLTTIGLIASLLPLWAQVGINTQQPLHILHIDPKNDTSGASGTTDDLVIDNTGQMGINITQPTAKLDVVGNMNIIDGSEANNHVMVSDADGLGTWTRLTYTTRINGNLPVSLPPLKNGMPGAAADFTNIGASITLSAGSTRRDWQIYFYCIYKNDGNNTTNHFSIWWDLSTNPLVKDVGLARVLSYSTPPNDLCPTYASFKVSVLPNKTVTYYIFGVIGNVDVYTPGIHTYIYNSDARLWAIPVNES